MAQGNLIYQPYDGCAKAKSLFNFVLSGVSGIGSSADYTLLFQGHKQSWAKKLKPGIPLIN